jgi:hypothetical protein
MLKMREGYSLAHAGQHLRCRVVRRGGEARFTQAEVPDVDLSSTPFGLDVRSDALSPCIGKNASHLSPEHSDVVFAKPASLGALTVVLSSQLGTGGCARSRPRLLPRTRFFHCIATRGQSAIRAQML